MTALTIPLAHPIEVNGALLSSIVIRPPTAEDVVAVGLLNVGRWVRGLRFISRLTGLSTHAVDEAERKNPEAFNQLLAFVSPHMGW